MPLAGPPLQTERLPNGQRKLLRELAYEWRGEVYKVPQGFVTDYSSYPVAALYWVVPLSVWQFDLHPLWMLVLTLVPSWHRVDLAGVLHDWAWRSGKLSFLKANLLWLHVAVSGSHAANYFQGAAGFLGLSTFGLVVYEKIKIFGSSMAQKAKKLIE